MRFLHFHKATKLDKVDKDVHISCFLFVMGKDADRIYHTFMTREETSFAEIFALFDAYFLPKKNIIHACAIFNGCQQQPEEMGEGGGEEDP